MAVASQSAVVVPGGTGRISWRVINPSGGPIEWQGVELAVSGPQEFEILPTSQKGPATIAVGGNFDFFVDYRISIDANAGFEVNLDILPPKNAKFSSDPASLHTSVNIIRKRPSFLDEPA